MKKILAIMVGLMISIPSVMAQTYRNVTVESNMWFTPTECVEVVQSDPLVITEQYVREGKTRLVANKLFTCVGDVDDKPCASIEEVLTEPYDMGKKWFYHPAYGWLLFKHCWAVPVYTGYDTQIIEVNETTRVIGVPKDVKVSSGKVYQMTPEDTLVLVYDKKDKFIKYYLNPKPTVKYPKNSQVIVCTTDTK